MGFSPDWLALREPVDHASRDAGLLAQAAACAGQGAIVVDLGSGTGSTARAFTGVTWQWRFVDGDATLLDIAQARHPGTEQMVLIFVTLINCLLMGWGWSRPRPYLI